MSKTTTIVLDGTLFARESEDGYVLACVGEDKNGAEDLNLLLAPYDGEYVTITIEVV